MEDEVKIRIEALAQMLWKEFRTVVELPDAVPEAERLQLMEEAYAEIQLEGNEPFDADCPHCRMLAAEGNWTRHYDFCSGWCPGCRILDWCETASSQHSAEEIAWMKANGSYPPDWSPADELTRHHWVQDREPVDGAAGN